MTKTALLIQLVYLILFGFGTEHDAGYPPIENESFQRGELLHFKMTYGIFTVGRGTATIGTDFFTVSDRDCFKVDVSAQTCRGTNYLKVKILSLPFCLMIETGFQ